MLPNILNVVYCKSKCIHSVNGVCKKAGSVTMKTVISSNTGKRYSICTDFKKG